MTYKIKSSDDSSTILVQSSFINVIFYIVLIFGITTLFPGLLIVLSGEQSGPELGLLGFGMVFFFSSLLLRRIKKSMVQKMPGGI